MLHRALLRDSLREIRRSPARFLSIFAIVAIGAALFSGIKGTAPDMKYTADQYYDQYRMMDIRVLSTLGLVPDDIAAIRSVAGVESVQPGYFVDVTTTVNSTEYVFRVHSLPEAASTDGQYLDMPKLVSGRMPANAGECVIEANRNISFGLGIGDTMTVSSGKADDLSKTLATSRYTIVGTVVSPYYLTFQREPSDIGSGRVNLFMMVGEREFLYPVYTEALVSVAGARALNSYSTEYSDLVESVVSRLENLGTERASLRLASIKADATARLDQGKAELATSEADYNKQIADGQAQLSDASNKLAAGRATLDSQKQNYAQAIAGYDTAIAQLSTAVSQGESQYAQAKSAYDSAASQLATVSGQLDSAIAQMTQVRDATSKQIDSLQQQLDDPTLTDEQRAQLQQQLDTETRLLDLTNQAMAAAGSADSAIKTPLATAQSQLQRAASQLSAARAQLNQTRAARNELAATAPPKFAAAERALADGQAQYEASAATFETKKAGGAKDLRAAQEKIIRSEDDIAALAEPSWYVLDRTKVYSYADYASTADRMDAIAALFPVFFFAVAALVCLTTMTRMVDEQRTSIGTYKALGYSGPAIAFKYVSYAALASVLGGGVGVAVGIRVFPRIIFDSWAMMYELPPMSETPQWPLLVLTVVVAAVLITATSYAAVRNELTAVPATLMRPRAPKAGKVILLERFTALWRRLSFSQKVTMRNIFRYKKRFFMTVIGVAGCAALLVAGLGLSDSIGQIVTRQYGDIFHNDVNVRLAPTISDAEEKAVMTQLAADPAVKGTMEISQLNATVKGPDTDIAATMITPLDERLFPDYIRLRDRVTQTPIALPDSGVVITEKLAKDLGVHVGDRITAEVGSGTFKKLTVAGITENYLFHYIYLSKASYLEMYRLEPTASGLMIQLSDKSAQNRIGSDLIQSGRAASVFYYSDASDKFTETVKSLNTIVWAMVISAGLLAFVVLYNLTNINLSERVREIATIKVLGFRNREVAAYVYRESLLLTFIGGLAGLLVGIGLHGAIMASIEQDNVMFGDYVSGVTFLSSLGITLLFGVLVSLVMYRKLTGIKMVESLKSVE
jgi:putative ABC transport system permease protein